MNKKRALVTGANRGIGLAIAHGLVDKGCDVVLGVRDLNSGKSIAHDIKATAVELDVSSRDSIRRAVGELGPVDILVNNAGVLGSGRLLDDPQDFETSMSVMVHGPYTCSRHQWCATVTAELSMCRLAGAPFRTVSQARRLMGSPRQP